MNTYKFTVQCKSGEWKTTEFQAENFRIARKMLDEFINAN